MNTLLMLAQHPSIPIDRLHYFQCGHHFGFSRVKESALRAYLFFNAAEATEILANGIYEKIQDEYIFLLREISVPSDGYPAQQIPRECGVDRILYGEASCRYVHEDYRRLQDYLKMLFELMYRYDVLLRECGMDPGWEIEMAYQFPLRGNVQVEWHDAQRRNVQA